MTAPRHARRPQPRSVDRFGPVFTFRVLLGSAMTAYRYDTPRSAR